MICHYRIDGANYPCPPASHVVTITTGGTNNTRTFAVCPNCVEYAREMNAHIVPITPHIPFTATVTAQDVERFVSLLQGHTIARNADRYAQRVASYVPDSYVPDPTLRYQHPIYPDASVEFEGSITLPRYSLIKHPEKIIYDGITYRPTTERP